MAKYDYQIVYDSYWSDTQENNLAIKFAEYFEKEVRKWGFKGYIEDRDLVPGRSIFDELFNVADSTEKTIFLITRFDSEWAQYAREAIFKHRIDSANRHNCIAIGLNLFHDDKLSILLQSMKINGPVYFHGDSVSQWEAEERSWNRMKKAFGIFEENEDIQSQASHMTNTGQEFRARPVQALMKKQGVIYSPTQNETKSSVAERAILTVKSRIVRYFTYKQTFSYLPILEDIARSYNRTFHSTIGTTPADVKDSNEEEVRLSTYFAQNKTRKKSEKLKRFHYKIGDHVRITYLRNIFTRAYDETYTGEVFRVSKRYHRGTLPVYKLQDISGDGLSGLFYESELQKVDYDPDANFKIEKIIKTKGNGNNKQYFVKWKYYPKKFNSWVKANDLQ